VDVAQRGLRLARELNEQGIAAGLLRVIGEIATGRTPPDVATAESSFREAMTIADAFGMRPMVAHAHAGLAELYARLGKRDAARTGAAIAVEMFRAMDMPFFVSRAETLLAKLGD
jgi:hypothetical protein